MSELNLGYYNFPAIATCKTEKMDWYQQTVLFYWIYDKTTCNKSHLFYKLQNSSTQMPTVYKQQR